MCNVVTHKRKDVLHKNVVATQPVFTFSESTWETPEQGVKCVLVTLLFY